MNQGYDEAVAGKATITCDVRSGALAYSSGDLECRVTDVCLAKGLDAMRSTHGFPANADASGCTLSSSNPSCEIRACAEGFSAKSEGGNGALNCTPEGATAVKTAKLSYTAGSTPLECQGIDCETLLDPAFGTVGTGNANRYPSTAIYDCDEGFQMNQVGEGGAIRTCDTAGVWEGVAPTCEGGVCEKLDKAGMLPAEMSVVYSPISRRFPNTATFSCDKGYVVYPIGDAARVCNIDGTWAGNQPKCVDVCAQVQVSPLTSTNHELYKVPLGLDVSHCAFSSLQSGHTRCDVTGCAPGYIPQDNRFEYGYLTCARAASEDDDSARWKYRAASSDWVYAEGRNLSRRTRASTASTRR